jgi:hypothetical protein
VIRRTARRTVRLLAALTLVLAPVVVAAPTASAVNTGKGTPGYCPDGNGVTVVIDFQELGGPTIIRCAPGDQATGHAALKNAGIEIAGVARWGEAFICRIEGKPGANSEACIDTPPASAYWSYWHAANNGTWTYSQWGVMNRKPPLGSFEGWSFSKDKTETTNPTPRVAPVRPAAKPDPVKPPPAKPDPVKPDPVKPDPAKQPKQPNQEQSQQQDAPAAPNTDPLAPGPGVAGNPMEPAPESPAAPAPSETPGSAAPAPGTSLEAAPKPNPSGTTADGTPWTGGEELANSGQDSGIPATTLAGIGLLVALCAGAGFTVVRRRRAAGGAS